MKHTKTVASLSAIVALGLTVGCADHSVENSRSLGGEREVASKPTESGAIKDLKQADSDEAKFGIRNGTLNGNSVYGGDFLAVGRMIYAPTGQTICTATLVTTRVILTAKHCLDKITSLSLLKFSIYNVGSSSGDELPVIGGYLVSTTIAGRAVLLDAVALTLKAPYNYNPTGVVNGPQQQFKGIIGFNGLRLAANSAVTVIGFGYTPSEIAGRRRIAAMKVGATPYSTFAEGYAALNVVPASSNSVICPADSGGPLLVQRSALSSSDIAFSGLNSNSMSAKFVIAGIARNVLGVNGISKDQWCGVATGAQYVPFDRYKSEIGGAIARADQLR